MGNYFYVTPASSELGWPRPEQTAVTPTRLVAVVYNYDNYVFFFKILQEKENYLI